MTKTKKADVEERPEAFLRVGLLFSRRPGSADSPFLRSSDDRD
jgi:hypothetical protein